MAPVSRDIFPRSRPFSPSPSSIFFIAGPCVIESETVCLRTAERLAAIARDRDVDILFKSSYDKANRTSPASFRGPGIDEGLEILSRVKQETGLAVVTDFHLPSEAAAVAGVADILQVPAFLCRQTDMLAAARDTGRYVNVKKGQFLSPGEMKHVFEKAGPRSLCTERGTFFGYHRLVVDYCGIVTIRTYGHPVIFDATHSVQQPGGGGGVSGGDRSYAVPLAKAAAAIGVDGLFFEVHPDPDTAACDGPNSLSLREFEACIPLLLEISALARRR